MDKKMRFIIFLTFSISKFWTSLLLIIDKLMRADKRLDNNISVFESIYFYRYQKDKSIIK